jgi:hypothetical protein
MNTFSRSVTAVVVVLAVVVFLAARLTGESTSALAGATPILVADSPTPVSGTTTASPIPATATPTAQATKVTLHDPASPTLDITATPAATDSPPTFAPVVFTMTPRVTLTPIVMPTSTVVPVTEAEARGVVTDLFAALDQDEYDRAISAGSGLGEQQIRALVSTLQSSAGRQGSRADLSVSDLTLDNAGEEGSARLTKAAFGAAVYSRFGPLPVTLLSTRGSAVFLVDRVAGEPKITQIRSITGLPGV